MRKIKVYSKPTDNMLSNLYKNYTNICIKLHKWKCNINLSYMHYLGIIKKARSWKGV